MATEEERIIRAYNIGYQLSAHEPKLLDQIIKNNKNNEFVKTMMVAKDHQEFNRGIPKKEFTREYKNGVHNARTLSEHEPELLDKIIASKETNKDFKKGLEAGKKEYKIRQTMQRMKQEREHGQQKENERDKGMEY
jgi:hypothetical protein